MKPIPAAAARLREFREAARLSRTDLAKKVGSHHNQIQKLEMGERRLNTEWIERLAKPLGRKPADFLTEQLPVPAPGSSDDEPQDLVQIPVYDIRFAAGAGADNEDGPPIDYFPMSGALLRTMTDSPVGKIAVFQVPGDSMEPTIPHQAWVLVDMGRTKLTSPGIYALVHDGEALMKRASQHLQTGAVTLVSDNPAYPPQTIKRPHNFSVIGRAFLAISRI